MKKFAAFVFIYILASCTEDKSSAKVPEPEKFYKDTDLMIKVTTKFANENDAMRLHKVAVSTQSSRMINCFDYMGECDQYLKFLSTAIRYSEDGNLSAVESSDLKKRAVILKSTIHSARAKLKQTKLN